MPFSLIPAALHEFYAPLGSDAAALSGLALALVNASSQGRPVLWIRHEAQDREAGRLYAEGITELGFDAARFLLVKARDAPSALQAGLEGARCGALGAVIIKFRGEARASDLVASRRLAQAAQAVGVLELVARVAAIPVPSAAQTRWQVRALPSPPLAANAPGNPAFEMTLLRARNGQEGLRYCVEWNRDARRLVSRFLPGIDDALIQPAPLSGAVVPVSFDRSGAAPDGLRKQAG